MDVLNVQEMVIHIREAYPNGVDVKQHAILVFNYGWDVTFLALSVIYGDSAADAMDKAYSDYIMGR